jgi:hypothetical protein
MDDERNDLVEIWRSIIQGDSKSWVLFEHGTCVILMQPEVDLAAQAKVLLAEWGPVQVGTDSADFNVIELENGSGWVVTCHHPDILTFVPADEDKADEPAEIMIGLMGRSVRDEDAKELKVIHIEDKRS